MPDARVCPACGTELPLRAPEGLCPGCLLRAGLDGAALSLSPAGDAGATVELAGSRVRETLAAAVGSVPRVLLRDNDAGAKPPVIRPTGSGGAEASIRYRIDGEIARGGMGAVLKGRDPDLGRDVALKVLREDLRDNADLVRRFIEEAQIGGQLQHPGIVPIYELGVFADCRPFFSMKLVKGRTLAELLAGRSSPSDGLPRFLVIFEQVCQTVAYAHARGVIHRDLKPSNIMVGGFGEVQVMDWGLAKVLPRGGAADDATAGHVPEQETIIATARSGGDLDGELSRAGSVMGTPSYMAPEQARGEVEVVDERADVFALGSILCEVLTGRPAFTGRSTREIQARAACGDLAEAFNRLGTCGADPELAALARDCLAPVRDERPRDASRVADRLAAFLASLERRLRDAELERAAQAARAEEALRTAQVAQARALAERRARRLQVGLAASVLATSIAGGLSLTWWLQQRSARLARVGLALREAELLEAQAAADPDGGLTRWPEARAALARASDLLTGADDPGATARVTALSRRIEAGAGAAERDRRLLDRLAKAQARREALLGNTGAAGRRWEAQGDAAYATIFREAGIDPDELDPAEFARRVRARPGRLAAAVVVALDDWAAARLSRAGADSAARAGLDRLRAAARALDPDPWRDALRDALAARDRGALVRLAADPRLAEQAPASLVSLAAALYALDERGRGLEVLRLAQRAHPGDARINLYLGNWLEGVGRHDEAVQYQRAAVALRPESSGARTALAAGLYFQHDFEDAIREAREAVRLEPDYPNARSNLAMILRFAHGESLPPQEARSDEAIAQLREALRIEPEWGEARGFLASILEGRGRTVEARAERARAVELLREAARREPEDSRIQDELGELLRAGGDLPAAAEAYREVARLRPESPAPLLTLGEILGELGRHAEAVAALREAAGRGPDDISIHLALGQALRRVGNYKEAAAAFRRANEITAARSGYAADYTGGAIQAVERLAAVAPRLPAVLRGEAQPADNAERLDLAWVAYDTRQFAAAARLFGEALKADPRLAADRRAGHRYNAACAAALAAAGGGADDPPPGDAARSELRRQALDWLKAELADWSPVLDSDDPQARAEVAPALRAWRQDPDLASVRDAAARAALPEAERADWQALWAEVDRLLGRAGEAR
jgi:serine/threonine protein kinase/predicted Zn-dependent protease